VRLNGMMPRNTETPVRLGLDRIEVDGKRKGAAERAYLMLDKPRGVVTTADDEKGRETIYSLLPRDRQWTAPVGRLDKASEGLLLLTNESPIQTHTSRKPIGYRSPRWQTRSCWNCWSAAWKCRLEKSSKRSGRDSLAQAKKTRGLKSSLRRAKTGRFVACWMRLELKYCA